MDSDIRNNRKVHRTLLNKLRGKERVNVIFIISSLSMWNHQQLYELMVRDPHFKATIIFVPFSVYSEDDNQVTQRQLTDFIKQHHTPFLIYDQLDFCHCSFVERFAPDILFYPQWYGELYPPNIDVHSHLDKLLCFIPYGIGVTLTGIGIHAEAVNFAWKIYQTCEAHLQASRHFLRSKGDNVIVVGHPRADEYAAPCIADPWKPQEKQKKRIIWAPHFTISGGISPLQRSNFLQIAGIMQEIAMVYKDQIQFAFKPHPRLITELYKHPEWGKDKTDAYYRQWETGINTQIETGEYVDLFKTSDALIHDSGSFTVEYLYVHKPAMFITRDCDGLKENDEMLDIGSEALDVHYIGFTRQDIHAFIDDVVLKGNDPMKEERECFFRRHLMRPIGKNTSQQIYDDICHDLWLSPAHGLTGCLQSIKRYSLHLLQHIISQ